MRQNRMDGFSEAKGKRTLPCHNMWFNYTYISEGRVEYNRLKSVASERDSAGFSTRKERKREGGMIGRERILVSLRSGPIYLSSARGLHRDNSFPYCQQIEHSVYRYPSDFPLGFYNGDCFKPNYFCIILVDCYYSKRQAATSTF